MKRCFIFILLLLLTQVNANADEQDLNQRYVYVPQTELKLVKTFQDWEVYHQISNSTTKCYAFASPYRTKAFEGVREAPYLIISFKGKMQYSISLNPGFLIDKNNEIILKTNNRSYLLNSALPNYAWTYSSMQDKAIIEDMIKDGRSLSVRSYNVSDDTALDFYSLKGMTEALKYMEENCLIFYN